MCILQDTEMVCTKHKTFSAFKGRQGRIIWLCFQEIA